MKKVFVTITLGAVLFVGATFAQDEPKELAGELEPSILSIELPKVYF